MAKKRSLAKQKKPEPHLAAALFCEKVLEDKDGVLSAVRIVDKIIMQSVAAVPPEAPKPVVALTALIVFRAIGLKGKRRIRVTGEDPTGTRLMNEITVPGVFKGPRSNFNLRANMVIPVDREGIYWFTVYLENRIVARMPLEVEFQK